MPQVTTITDLEVSAPFYDDHMMCLPIRFKDQDGMRRDLTLWWCGLEGHAAATYAHESQMAMTELLKFVNAQIKNDEEESHQ